MRLARQHATAGTGDRYKWVALSNTTAGVFMSALDGSIVIIALPAIFRGIHLDPLAPGNVFYLLWMIMGYRLVQAVLVVNLGRLGDMFGRVKIYNAGFAVFTLASILLSFDPYYGARGALWLQGVPAALAHQIGSLPPVASLFAAVLGVNPVQHVLAARGALSSLSAAHQRVLTGRQFFPELISGPFHQGLSVVLAVATALAAIAALASLLRGRRPAVATPDPASQEAPAGQASQETSAGAGQRAGSQQQISA
jgi:MFS family permease